MKANDLQHKARVYEISHRLAVMLGQVPMDAPEFIVKSATREGVDYQMVVTPEGIAVHVGEGCEAEFFYMDVMKCRHSKEGSSVMTQLTPYQAPSSPVEITFNEEQMKVITSTIAKGATPTELELFVATCKRTGLDPFLKQIYAVKRYDSKEQREVMAIQVGIDGLRLIAERTGKYGGQDPIEWLDVDGVWSEVWTARGDFPVAARTAVYRKDWTQKAPAVCRWDSYAQYFGKERKLSPMWDKMPDVMLGKCAEALALRRAFPAEMSGMAAAIDADYDPSTDLELQQPGVWDHDSGTYIEGEIVQPASVSAPPKPAPRPPIEHEESQQAPANVSAGTPASPGGVATPAAPSVDEPDVDAMRAAIHNMLVDCKQTWSPKDYGDLFRELSIFMPDTDAKFDPKSVDGERAAACVAYLRERRGEAVPV